MTNIATLRKRLVAATKAAERASEARRALPPGSSRARVTTANARWAARCEERDRIMAQLEQAERSEWG